MAGNKTLAKIDECLKPKANDYKSLYEGAQNKLNQIKKIVEG